MKRDLSELAIEIHGYGEILRRLGADADSGPFAEALDALSGSLRRLAIELEQRDARGAEESERCV